MKEPLSYTLTWNQDDVPEKLQPLKVRVFKIEVSDGKQICGNLEVYPVNQPASSSVSRQLMVCIYGFNIQMIFVIIISTLVLPLSEI